MWYVGGEVRGRVLQPPGLRVELERAADARQPRGALVDDHVADQDVAVFVGKS